MDRAKKAKELFEGGYTCSQAVALAFADLFDIEEATLSALASPFGGGMGRMREVCGAVSGSLMILGLTEKYTDPKDSAGKMALYSKVRDLADEFKAENGSIICRELIEGVKTTSGGIPEERTPEYYKKRPCGELVESAARLVEERLKALSML